MSVAAAVYSGGELRQLWQGQQPQRAGLLFEARLVNYTPLMLGDHQGRHLRCLDPQCSSRAPSPGLFAQALRGKARWLARTVLASLEGCSGYQTYREIEQSCAPVTVTLGPGERVKLGLIEYMFGTIRPGHQYSSPFNLSARIVRLENKQWNPKTNISPKWLPDRYHALLRRNDPHGLQRPLAPGTVEIEVRAYLASNADTSRSRFWDVASFYVGLIAAAPLLLGLGKASTRGFGRFTFSEEPKLGDYVGGSEPLRRLLYYMMELGRSYSEEKERRKLHSIIRGILQLGSSAASMSIGRPSIARIPRLVNAVSSPKHIKAEATVVRIGARCVDDTVIFIAASAAKSYWKNSRWDWRTDSGLRFHTWPLGLPRTARPNCKCFAKGGKRVSKPDLAFGYVVAEEQGIPKREDDGAVDVCLPYSECLEQAKIPLAHVETIDGFLKRNMVTIRGRKVSGVDVRHMSMFTLFPLPRCRDGRDSLVAVLPFVAFSLNMSIDEEQGYVARSRSGGLHLLHLGGHTGGKFPPCCNTHVVDVGYAIKKDGDVVGAVLPGNIKNGNLSICDCGSDRGGIQGPPNSNKKYAGYLGAIEAAYDWLLYCLKRLRYTDGRIVC